ncbi:hypothetical protein LZ30DRAFT_45323 [Colletotrichum cereale]|nr:hypothetical protein LZ30DRAFT_45323 [Colletotrichum cereale]
MAPPCTDTGSVSTPLPTVLFFPSSTSRPATRPTSHAVWQHHLGCNTGYRLTSAYLTLHEYRENQGNVETLGWKRRHCGDSIPVTPPPPRCALPTSHSDGGHSHRALDYVDVRDRTAKCREVASLRDKSELRDGSWHPALFSQTCMDSNKPRGKSTVFHGSLHGTACRFGNRGHFGSCMKTRKNATMMRRGPLCISHLLRSVSRKVLL